MSEVTRRLDIIVQSLNSITHRQDQILSGQQQLTKTVLHLMEQLNADTVDKQALKEQIARLRQSQAELHGAQTANKPQVQGMGVEPVIFSAKEPLMADQVSPEMQTLIDQVTATVGEEKSATVLLNNLVPQIQAVAGNKAATLKLAADLKASMDDLAGAVTANSPVVSVTPAAPTGPAGGP